MVSRAVPLRRRQTCWSGCRRPAGRGGRRGPKDSFVWEPPPLPPPSRLTAPLVPLFRVCVRRPGRDGDGTESRDEVGPAPHTPFPHGTRGLPPYGDHGQVVLNLSPLRRRLRASGTGGAVRPAGEPRGEGRGCALPSSSSLFPCASPFCT